MSLPKIAILDDSQNVAAASADWSRLDGKADVAILKEPFASQEAAEAALQPYAVIVPMRERTPLPKALIDRLPNLKMIALTGPRSPSLDIAACTARRVIVCNTGGDHSTLATAELTFGLILAGARGLGDGHANMRAGRWHENLPLGFALSGKTLGVLGLGKLGSRVAKYAQAFGMNVIAWSQNLTADAAEAAGCRRVEKDDLLRSADVVSIHLVLSDRSRGLISEREIGLMKPGALLVNTSRGPIVDEAAMLHALAAGRIRAALDVYDDEPPAADHPLRTVPNVTLAPHLGYGSDAVFRQFYGESLENIEAFLAGKPIRVMNPEAAG
ncbi:MAG: D-2-hydroxyacid dehydrogenase family protein [Beijerinckiaceae bacterium]